MRNVLGLLLLLLSVAACDDGRQPEATVTEKVDLQAALADTTRQGRRPAPTRASLADAEGQVFDHPEAGFSIYWPAGCRQVREQESRGATALAEREVILNCVRPDLAFSVRYLRQAHDQAGNPPHPRFVVALVEQQLHRKAMRTVRQRTLEAASVQGVDVHAEGRDSRKWAWMRALLVGTDVYLLMVIGEDPDLFERPEVSDFFNSFNLDSVDE